MVAWREWRSGGGRGKGEGSGEREGRWMVRGWEWTRWGWSSWRGSGKGRCGVVC